ncbi:HAMP domain-containing protein [uncultured Hymenobacter sp.]|uniref:HAMP domain-containing protein n=1 Tax=uncultured Hymenobacter sp. TaxID=170016 RepID=UPI0035CA3759
MTFSPASYCPCLPPDYPTNSLPPFAMQASIKTKLTRGLAFLFLIIVLLSGVGAYFLYQLSQSAEATLVNNYRSVTYAQRLADALADLREARTAATSPDAADATRARAAFAAALRDEQANITEPGEGALADSLAAGFGQYLAADPTSEAARAGYQRLRRQAGRVAALNLRAIEQQNQRTRRVATRTIATLGLLAAVGILATFSFIFSFPDYVIKPVEELTAGIRRLAAGDYRQRLPTQVPGEFAEVAVAFNDMARKLEGYETPDGTPRIDSSGALDVVRAHRQPGAQGPTPPTVPNPEQQRLMQQLREQSRQLQRTAEALLAGPGA